MKTYIVNLESSPERKEYMENLLKDIPALEYEFIKAVDGRKLTDSERNALFDSSHAFKRYGRECRPGEIGCTLSHQQCYKKIAESAEDYALILEDDIVINCTDNAIWEKMQAFLCKENKPMVLLLSGNYWYSRTQSHKVGLTTAYVFDAYGTFAYLINKKAAKLLIEYPATFLADDWRYLRSKGIKLQAIYPHPISPSEESLLSSTILTGIKRNDKINKQNLPFATCISTYIRGGIRHFLKFIKHYEGNWG